MKKYVITGGPGIGKTTIIELLALKRYTIIPEVARIIIEEEKIKDSECLPWKNLHLFQKKVAERQLEIESKAVGDIIFLDRGVVDGYGYCKNGGVAIPEIIVSQGKNRYEKIFLPDILPQYKTDESRIEDEESAKKIHKAIADAYKEFGYDVIVIPVVSPEERINLILKEIN